MQDVLTCDYIHIQDCKSLNWKIRIIENHLKSLIYVHKHYIS